MKKCIDCNIEKEDSSFNLRSKKSELRQSRCKECESKNARLRYLKNREKRISKQRKINILNKYGITEELYNSMLNEQKGKCAICGSKEIKRKGAK